MTQSIQTQVQKPKPMTVQDLVLSQEKAMQMALPRHMNTDRFMRMCLTTIRMNPKLQQCDAVSLLGAFIQCAQLGLEPSDSQGEAYIIPFKGTATFITGYAGLVKLARNSGQLKGFVYEVVYANDTFEYELGLSPKLKHIPTDSGDRGVMTHVYAAAMLKGGGREFKVMSRDQCVKHRDRFSKMPNGKAWRDNFDSMALKTVIRKLCKLLPKSAEINVALHLGSDGDSNQHMERVALDAGIVPPDGWSPPVIVPDLSEDATTIKESVKESVPEDTKIQLKTEETEKNEDDAILVHDKALGDFAEICGQIKEMGGDANKILDLPDVNAVMSYETSQIKAAITILENWGNANA